MRNKFIKLILKLIIIISALECIYLYVLPYALNKYADKKYILSVLNSSSSAVIGADKLNIKTHFPLSASVSASGAEAEKSGRPLLRADNFHLKFRVLPLLFKKIEPEKLSADNLQLYIRQEENGRFNFENLFMTKSGLPFKLRFKNFEIKTSGGMTAGNKSPCSFDVNLRYSEPFSVNDFSKNDFEGSIIIYNLNLKEYAAVLKKLLPDLKETSGIIDFLQISAEKNGGIIETSLNSEFKDLLYSSANWKNSINAQKKNKISASIDLYKNILKIKHFSFNAENTDIFSFGEITLKNKPELDINIKVKNSRAENIAALLPPDLVKETMVIEKVKTYGIEGDIEGDVHITGAVPKPDVKGRVKGRNIRILDEKTRKLHKGTANLTFEGRTLNMDILIEMPKGQKAEIKGRTYMYRDGANDVSVKTSNQLDFPLAAGLAVPVSRVFNFQLGPLPDMNITSGKGALDIRVKGSPEFIDLKGNCVFKNAALTYNGLEGRITGASGRLDLEKDVIKVSSNQAFINNMPFKTSGAVKINDSLHFDISSKNAEAEKLLKIINNSLLLNDVKKGLALFNNAHGSMELSFDISSDIVPVPFGHPPLRAEEAFKNIHTKGYAGLNGVKCFLEGFKTPLENIRGKVNFTEKNVNFKNLHAEIGSSSVKIDGNIDNDLNTKIPDADITAAGSTVKTGDTIRFLADSYFYPDNYPDISFLYNIDAQHDLYLKYKAKSADFLTDKIYASMNFIKGAGSDALKAESGRIIMQNAAVNIENVTASVFGKELKIFGTVTGTDTAEPVYNIKMICENFNLENLNRLHEVNIAPDALIQALNAFSNYNGFMDFSLQLEDNVMRAEADLKKLSFNHKKSGLLFNFDDFTISSEEDKILSENITADISGIPVFLNVKAENIYKSPYIEAYAASKLTDSFIQSFLPEYIADKIKVSGDISISADINGAPENINIKPQITLFPAADAAISGVKIGDSSDKRVFNADINIKDDTIEIDNLNFYTYIAALDKTIHPVLFSSGGGILKLNNETGLYEAEELYIKTEKNLSARLLNIFSKKPYFKQGTLNGALSYKKGKLDGSLNAENIDIPLADTVIKNIKLNTDEEDIYVKLFGFISDSAVIANFAFDNNLAEKPHVDTLKIRADRIDTNKLLGTADNIRSMLNNDNQADTGAFFSLLEIEEGEFHADYLSFKNAEAEDINSRFSIDKNGNVKFSGIDIKLAGGSVSGEISYGFKNADINMQLDFKNIDSNYFTENLLDAENQIYGAANAQLIVETKGSSEEEFIRNLSGFLYFDISDGRMPKLGSLEYLLRAGNIIKGGITGFTINNILEILNLVKTGYFSNISGSSSINNGIAENIEIFSAGENMSLYIHGSYDIVSAYADLEVLGRLSNRISTIFGPIGNASLNTLFKLIPGVSFFESNKKSFLADTAKIPSFTNGTYDARTFQALIKGDINSSKYVQSFKWVK